MKQGSRFVIGIVILAVSYFFFNSSGPVSYNNKLVDLVENVSEKMISFYEAIEKEGQALLPRYNAILAEVDRSLEKARAMADYKGNTEFRDKGIALLEYYKSAAENQCKELCWIFTQEKITEEMRSDAEALFQELEESEDPYFNDFAAIQEAFALEFDFKLEKK